MTDRLRLTSNRTIVSLSANERRIARASDHCGSRETHNVSLLQHLPPRLDCFSFHLKHHCSPTTEAPALYMTTFVPKKPGSNNILCQYLLRPLPFRKQGCLLLLNAMQIGGLGWPPGSQTRSPSPGSCCAC